MGLAVSHEYKTGIFSATTSLLLSSLYPSSLQTKQANNIPLKLPPAVQVAMTPSKSPAGWLDMVDYENYAKNCTHDENRVTFPEVGDPYDGTFTDQNPSNNPPTQGEVSEKALVSESREGENVGEAREEEEVVKNEVSAQDPRSLPAASTPLTREHPRAATIRGRTAGWQSCDTCHARKRRCDHGEDGLIDPELAARAHKKRKTMA